MNEFRSLNDIAFNSRYIVVATVNEDGTPHNSPMFYIPSPKLDKLYMGTYPESQHAQNIARTGEAFGVVFGQTPDGGRGLYFQVQNFHQVTDDELPNALDVHNTARAKWGKQPLPVEYYKASNPQRMYVGDIVEVTTNDIVRDSDGRVQRDVRVAIQPTELL